MLVGVAVGDKATDGVLRFQPVPPRAGEAVAVADPPYRRTAALKAPDAGPIWIPEGDFLYLVMPSPLS